MRTLICALLLTLSFRSSAQQTIKSSNYYIPKFQEQQPGYRNTVACATRTDFSYKQNICNPFTVAFNCPITNPQSIKWNFGDGGTAIAVSNPSHTFAGNGNCNWGVTKNFHFMIYDRWGSKVFESNNAGACWDGQFKGQPANAGGYVYHITGEGNCGKIIKYGNVLLIR